ncbi:MAG: putative protease, partial [Chthonomonadaceae bacterium]|nr:putative protease [Chthonomonadaceae bacterium]
QYQVNGGRIFRAPSNEPQIPALLSGRLAAVVGLDTAAVWRTHYREKPAAPQGAVPLAGPGSGAQPRQTGSGPGGGLTPSDIKTAYNLNATGANGAGQALALFELDGYKVSDITSYESYFGLPNVPLQNVLVDGYSGAAGSGAGEVTLDIELQIALAPSISKIYVYEGPNSNAGVVDTYNRIATDNLAKSISTSWGLAENSNASSTRNSENQAFQQMAAQGQSIFAASGDSGAYDNGSTLSVDDPASQPYMTGVGGTSLTTVSAGGAWKSETTWNRGSIANGAGGGGVSTVWAKPSYQSTYGTSSTARNVPDVSLDADPYTGYSIYFNGTWNIYGGTSCAAPLWSAFVACVNQSRVAAAKGTLGFANPLIYQIGAGSNFGTDFHDIADNSTNLYYHATTGYDNATGWGSINGTGLFTDLVNGTSGSTVTIPNAPTNLVATAGNAQVSLSWTTVSGATSYNVYRSVTNGSGYAVIGTAPTGSYLDSSATNGTTYYYVVTAVNTAGESAKSSQVSATPTTSVTGPTQLLGNPGFENGANAAPWSATGGVIDNSTGQPAHSGSWKAWLDGYGRAHTDTLAQTVTVPSTITTATLTFWLHIDTAEITTTAANDTLKVQIRNSAGTVLATLATYSNLNKASGYSQKTFDLSAYKGQTIQLYLIGVENGSRQTSFVVDDFSLLVQ